MPPTLQKEVPEQVRKTELIFYQIAFSSLMEVTSQLAIVKELEFIDEQEHERAQDKNLRNFKQTEC